uniref:SAM-dependent methyltransferase TRM5/TYW2-type domain-containing protein n=1 Tax=Oncorhynchus kisutch TaxID=8019 RepID=A0A8C7HKJ8_ONCKI
MSKRPLLRFVIAGLFLEYSHYYQCKTACNPAIDTGPSVLRSRASTCPVSSRIRCLCSNNTVRWTCLAVEGSDNDRLLLLDPASVSSPNSFSDAEAEVLRSFGVPQELQGTGYHSGFSRVCHIAHMNLREHQLPYRNLIGQVIMDKNPWVTCVVNKTNTIDSTYRFFKMVMVGEENMVAKVRENGVTYEFDFSCVYWNCQGFT